MGVPTKIRFFFLGFDVTHPSIFMCSEAYLSNQSITSVMPGAGGCLTRENTQECRAVFPRCRAVFVHFFHF